jgi:cyclophilin family peptidyl-prolyl cis-trans isomerase
MYPQTVQHFIELADNGFYDNTIIHDYKSSYWYGGGYSYNATVNGEVTDYATAFADNALAEYLENNSKEKAYEDLFAAGKLTPSVYKESSSDGQTTLEYKSEDVLSTLIGEFSDSNQHTIEEGELTSSYGCLRMYYSSKDTDVEVKLKKDKNNDKLLLSPYKYNSATSLFDIQVGSGTSTDSSYCIFAQLTNTDVLEDLQDAIDDYISDSTYTSSTFTSTATLYIDNYDAYIAKQVNQGSFALTASPLVITSVKITKY